VRRREIDPRLPFLGAAIVKRFWRNPELHGHPPYWYGDGIRVTVSTEIPDGSCYAQYCNLFWSGIG
jgi:hypothetical protein